ncbi:MAG: formylglycine-generating enzyme family protein [Candidatus Zophobacter franzmannii]|nr:formylglycine-generating enzyme family protein [Candidatus Zophobacter franzmannii]
MQKFLLFAILGLLLSSLFSAEAEIENIRFENDNGRVIITYDLISEEPVNIIVKAVRGDDFIVPGAIAGNIIDVQPGLDKQIWWEPYLEQLNPEDWTIELSVWSGDYVFVQGSDINFEDNSTVSIKAFYVGTYEVTQKDWCEVMDSNPAKFENPENPVENVRWDQVIEFCNIKSKNEGLTPCYEVFPDSVKCYFNADGYRLPYEVEWEYCASGGVLSNLYSYSGSKDVDEVAWYDEMSDHAPSIPGQLSPNELGIYDMSGNVEEWCWDNYLKDRSKPVYDVRKSRVMAEKVIKGGSWFANYKKCKIEARSGESPDTRDFRLRYTFFRTAQK